MRIGVDCTFSENGTVHVRRIKVSGSWRTVSQGRQWVDGHGRHILIMRPGAEVQEIVLLTGTLVWELVPRRSTPTIA